LSELYGKSVHHCPYCDGLEHLGQSLAVLGSDAAGLALTLEMPVWSADVVYCSNGSPVAPRDRVKLAEAGILVEERSIARLEGTHGKLSKIDFHDGGSLPRHALFFVSKQRQNCHLARSLGCRFDDGDFVECETNGVQASVPGVYAAGNASSGLQLAIVAAAEGAKAAHEINNALSASL
jgi:thioredoxin reductase